MGRRVQRAAGTQSFGDLLRHPGRVIEALRGAAPQRSAADAEALRAGQARAVVAFVREEGCFRQGYLILDPASAPAICWTTVDMLGRAVRPHVPVRPPFHLFGVTPLTGPGSHRIKRDQFRLVSIEAADRHWELAIPTIDVPLFRVALHPQA